MPQSFTQWHNDLAPALSLDGDWEFSLAGKSGQVRVPGCWEAQGFDRRADGPAQMQRTIFVPADWHGSRIHLQFDAVSYYVEVNVNGTAIDSHTGSWTAFYFDVSEAIRVDAENTISLTIYKPGGRFPLRESLTGFLPDVMMMFGGVWQSARLVAFSGPALSDISIQCDAEAQTVRVFPTVHHADGLTRRVTIDGPTGNVALKLTNKEDDFPRYEIYEASIAHPALWSPDHPALYTVEITLSDGDQILARVRRTCGFRTLSHEGDQLLFNAQSICLRGVLNWGWYPEILCPAPDVATIRDEFERVRKLGFNMIKLCLYVPSELYFAIADEMGMLLWLELPLWQPEVTDRLRLQAPIEYADIFRIVHRHPSIVIYSLGCELGSSVDVQLLQHLNTIASSHATGVLFCDNSGSGEAYGGLSHDFADFNDYHFYCDLHYFDPLVDHFSRDWRPPRPWIFGEFNDADDYRDVSEIAAAYGGDLPWWLAERNPLHAMTFPAYAEQTERMQQMRDLVGLDDQALVRLSRQESFVVRKTILEKVRARAGMGGYVVTGLRDTPLATSAVYDDLQRSKYDVDSFRRFNADTVLLLGWGRQRVWMRGGDRPAPTAPFTALAGKTISFNILLSHSGQPLISGELVWQLVDSERYAIAGLRQAITWILEPGCAQIIGTVNQLRIPDLDKPTALQIETFFSSGGLQIRNSWPLWVFPEIRIWPDDIAMFDPAGSLTGLDDLAQHAKAWDPKDGNTSVLITTVLNDAVREFVESGGSVLLCQQGASGLPAQACPFWREGIKIIGDHPVMAAMPHAGYVDLQFYGFAPDWAFETAKVAAALPGLRSVRPLLRRLDARQFTVLDYLCELQVGAGRLMATTLRFQGGAGDQPVGLQSNTAARWLLYQLLETLKTRPN